MTTATKAGSLLRFVAGAALLSVLIPAGARGLNAGQEEPEGRVGLSLAVGAFRAGQGSFRSLYGDVQAPLHVQLDVFLFRNVSLFAGYRRLSTDGSTQIVGPVVSEEHHPLQLRVSSYRAGAGVHFPGRRLVLLAAIGASFNRVRERWLDQPLDAAVGGTGVFGRVGVGYRLGRRWLIFGRLEYSTLPTDEGSALEANVNLDGVEAALGLMFRI